MPKSWAALITDTPFHLSVELMRGDGRAGSAGELDMVKELVFDTGRVGSAPPNLSRHRKGRLAGASVMVLAAAFILGACLAAVSIPDRDQAKSIRASPLFAARSPIMIEDDSELTLANGVMSGSGTASDPFVIEGWEIDASSSTIAGIAVSNITSYLLIRNVYVHSGGATSFGIEVVNFTHCRIERSQLSGNYVGIGALMCDRLTVVNNTIGASESGGVTVVQSNNSIVAHNLIVNNAVLGLSIAFSDSTLIENNTITGNSGAGVALVDTDMTMIINNVMEANQFGFEGVSANQTTMQNNQILNNSGAGIFGLLCTNSTFEFNTVAYSSPGLSATMAFSSDNLITSNNLISVITPQANDDSTTDHWNGTVSGNYWSDHTGPDGDLDGIVDTPYTIPTAAEDHFPLTTAVPLTDWPIAVFTVAPLSGTTSTSFDFNSSLSRDPVEATSTLEVRWDFDGDGTWDTSFSTTKAVQHSYTAAGNYNATMELRDGSGHSANFTMYVEVEQVVIPELSGAAMSIIALMAMVMVARAVTRRK